MQQVRPDVKILFVSSATGAVAAQAAGLMRTGDAFLGKPFTYDTLCRAVRGVLDA